MPWFHALEGEVIPQGVNFGLGIMMLLLFIFVPGFLAKRKKKKKD